MNVRPRLRADLRSRWWGVQDRLMITRTIAPHLDGRRHESAIDRLDDPFAPVGRFAVPIDVVDATALYPVVAEIFRPAYVTSVAVAAQRRRSVARSACSRERHLALSAGTLGYGRALLGPAAGRRSWTGPPRGPADDAGRRGGAARHGTARRAQVRRRRRARGRVAGRDGPRARARSRGRRHDALARLTRSR